MASLDSILLPTLSLSTFIVNMSLSLSSIVETNYEFDEGRGVAFIAFNGSQTDIPCQVCRGTRSAINVLSAGVICSLQPEGEKKIEAAAFTKELEEIASIIQELLGPHLAPSIVCMACVEDCFQPGHTCYKPKPTRIPPKEDFLASHGYESPRSL